VIVCPNISTGSGMFVGLCCEVFRMKKFKRLVEYCKPIYLVGLDLIHPVPVLYTGFLRFYFI